MPFSIVQQDAVSGPQTSTTPERGVINRPYILAQSAVPISLITCNTGLTWTLAADPANGKTRITASGAHGLTAGVAAGKNIYISAWSGTGVVGLYNIATVVSTTQLDIDLTYAAGLGNPTVAPAGTEVALASIVVPGGAMGANGALRTGSLWSYTNSANNKFLSHRFGGSLAGPNNSVTTTNCVSYLSTMRNRGSQASQVVCPYGSDTSAPTVNSPMTLTKDTSVNQILTLTAQPTVVNEFVKLEAYTVEVLRMS